MGEADVWCQIPGETKNCHGKKSQVKTLSKDTKEDTP